MKKVLFASLILVAGVSQATSLKKVNIRLQGVSSLLNILHNLPAGKRLARVVTVDGEGQVIGAQCKQKENALTNCRNIQVIERLSQTEQRRMEMQIARARNGEIKYPQPGGIHCMAIPVEAFKNTADNGRILLNSGSRPCGPQTYNLSPAAQSLIETLSGYQRKYNELINN
jgi:hypothetical protein